METMGIMRFISGLCRGYMGMTENKMQTTIVGLGFCCISGLEVSATRMENQMGNQRNPNPKS